MNGLVKFGLIGAGAFALYEYFYGSVASVPVTATGAPTTTTSIAPAGVSTTPVAASLPKVTANQLLVASGGQANLNVYQWNFYYDKLTGKGSALQLVTFPVDGSVVVDVNTYLGYLSSLGLSGVRSSGALGAIIDLFSGPKQDKIGWGVGDEDFLRSGGMGGIVDDAMNNSAYIDVGPIIEASQVGTPNSDTLGFYQAAGLV